jgi:hypothetical protein
MTKKRPSLSAVYPSIQHRKGGGDAWTLPTQLFWKIPKYFTVSNICVKIIKYILKSMGYAKSSEYLKNSFIHSVFCLTTGPKPPLKRFLHIVRSRASSFKWEYPLPSLRSFFTLFLNLCFSWSILGKIWLKYCRNCVLTRISKKAASLGDRSQGSLNAEYGKDTESFHKIPQSARHFRSNVSSNID